MDFDYEFTKNIILVIIPTGIGAITSKWITNSWQVRNEKLSLQKKIFDEFDETIIKEYVLLKSFLAKLWNHYADFGDMDVKEDYGKPVKFIFPNDIDKQPRNLLKKDFLEMAEKYNDYEIGVTKFQSTLVIYYDYDELTMNSLAKILRIMGPLFTELRIIIESTNAASFEKHMNDIGKNFRQLETDINHFRNILIKLKIKRITF
ncbi:MAG TPA: hypothetical protein VFA69_06290 [Candidatus Nitrosotalea sp.]|nr:hypothetical protein [Candidatus Nitrosotalea sp.]